MRVDLPEDYRPSEDETYMNPKQPEYFKQKLLRWREQLVEAPVLPFHLKPRKGMSK
jgi:DnaK suppressor protein